MTVSGKRLYLLLAALVVLGAMVAVALTERSAQRAGAITSFQVSPLPGEVTYGGGSIRLEVPDKAAVPAITPEQAMSTYQRDGAPPGLDKLGGVADVHLAVFSDASYGSYDANGNIIPKYQRVLSWVIIFHNVAMVPHGLGRTPGVGVAEAPSTTYPKCDALQFINASTGDFMLATKTCEHVLY
jgi:hypothetical protein